VTCSGLRRSSGIAIERCRDAPEHAPTHKQRHESHRGLRRADSVPAADLCSGPARNGAVENWERRGRQRGKKNRTADVQRKEGKCEERARDPRKDAPPTMTGPCEREVWRFVAKWRPHHNATARRSANRRRKHRQCPTSSTSCHKIGARQPL